ncbi:Taste receptor type 2 member 3 [Galemys pyrenaicus]|uniref:Taste receptor type 2 member 3 n=1 Tax=Galemys pyrenaicus TaxID=202257 RepID=A0A8J6AM51_GALPY|nr:Taste receptor type 2 member 3 [Galemys pyrenaicus]
MLGLTEVMFLLLSTTQFILGMLGNSFIVWVHGSGWLKSKRISLSEFIIVTLALSRIILLSTLLFDCVLAMFFYKVHDEGILMQIVDIIWTFTNHLSIWLVTCLNTLYCLKIASFSHPTFLWLKWRVSRLVAWMLLGALLLSCANALSLIHEFKVYSDFSGIDATRNMTEYFRKKSEYHMIHILGTLWNFPPLIVSLASSFLLILSLGRHTRQMQQNGTSSHDASTEAHKRALKIIFSFLFLFLLYFISFLIAYSRPFLPGIKMIGLIGVTLTMFYPTGHTFILILGNNKLKEMFVNMMWHKSCMDQRMLQIMFFSAVTVAASLNFVGLIASLFIAVVICQTWVKSHRLSSFDRLLFSLGINRFLLLGLFLLNVICFFVSPNVVWPAPVTFFILFCWMFLDSNSLWFVTLLNALYCVKITNFRHSVFLLLKRSLPQKTPQLLLACVLISAFSTLLYLVVLQTSSLPELVAGGNGTEFHIHADVLFLVTSFMLNSFLQFIINVTSASLLINSLKRYVQKMQRSATKFWNPQTEVHVGAMKLMIYFLVLYIPCFVTTMFLYLPSIRIGLEARSVCMTISTLYHPGHSVLIILTHPKLKTKAKKFLSDMLGLTEVMFLLLSTTQFILGMLGNSFIVWVHGSGWLKSKRISLSEFIIVTLALSRIILLFSLLADGVLMVFPSKWRVSRLVAWMLLGALLLSCASALSLIHEFKVYSDFSGINVTRNATEHLRKKSEYELIHGLGILWNFPPLIVSLASSFLLILSLGRHTRQMQQNGTSSSDPSTEAHKRALKIIFSFLFLFLLYFLALLMISSSHFLPGTKIIRMIGDIIKMFYPTGHSFILILGCNKLKQMFVEMFWYEPCHLKCGSKIMFFSAVTVAASLNFVGLIASLFIAVVICQTWVKSHRLSSFDRLLFSLGINRFLLLGLFLLNVICFFVSPNVVWPAPVTFFILFCWMFLDSNSLWFVTLLNALYCVKITNFRHSVFLLLKRSLPQKTPQLLLACVLISAFSTLLYLVVLQTSSLPELVAGGNGTEFHIHADVLFLVTSFMLNSFLQFIINVTSASLLINSLKRYVQKMQRSATKFWNPQTEVHVGAMKLMIYFLVLYIPYSSTILFFFLGPSAAPGSPPQTAMRSLLPAMLTPAALGLLMLVAVTEFLIGLVANGVLAVWSFGELVRKFRGSVYHLLILGLAVCRFLLQWLTMMDLSLFPFSKSRRWALYLNTISVLISQVSLWFATFLSVFYYRKITTVERPVCLWLRKKTKTYCLTLWCLLGCLVISLLIVAHTDLKLHNSSQGNSSILYPGLTRRYVYIYMLQLSLGGGLPFMVFLLFSGMLIVSLYRHHKKMQVCTSGRSDAQAKAHITALNLPLCLTSLFISETLMAVYPSLHSVVLIMGNPRVKQTCQRMLWRSWGP